MAGPISVATSALSTLSKAELSNQITELAGHLNAGTYRFLVLLAEFDRRQAWSDGSTSSCAHCLNWQCGIDLGAAREKLRVAHALETLPKIADAMARGVLSYSKVRALTRVACPVTEDALLMTAVHGTASHVEKLVRYYRRAREAEELSRAARQHLTRGLTCYHDDDGSLVLKGRLPAEVGELDFTRRGASRTGNSHRPKDCRLALYGLFHGLRARAGSAVSACEVGERRFRGNVGGTPQRRVTECV